MAQNYERRGTMENKISKKTYWQSKERQNLRITQAKHTEEKNTNFNHIYDPEFNNLLAIIIFEL